MSSIDTGGGGTVGGNVGTGGGNFTGRDEADHRNNVNVYYEDRPPTEREKVAYYRQFAELRYALLGDARYGVDGIVDGMRKIWIWLYVLVGLVVVLIIMQAYQQIQIQQMFEILERLQRLAG